MQRLLLLLQCQATGLVCADLCKFNAKLFFFCVQNMCHCVVDLILQCQTFALCCCWTCPRISGYSLLLNVRFTETTTRVGLRKTHGFFILASKSDKHGWRQKLRRPILWRISPKVRRRKTNRNRTVVKLCFIDWSTQMFADRIVVNLLQMAVWLAVFSMTNNSCVLFHRAVLPQTSIKPITANLKSLNPKRTQGEADQARSLSLSLSLSLSHTHTHTHTQDGEQCQRTAPHVLFWCPFSPKRIFAKRLYVPVDRVSESFEGVRVAQKIAGGNDSWRRCEWWKSLRRGGWCNRRGKSFTVRCFFLALKQLVKTIVASGEKQQNLLFPVDGGVFLVG